MYCFEVDSAQYQCERISFIGEGLKHKRFMKEENESETMKLQNLQEKFDNHTENIDEYEAQMKPIHERLVSIDKLRRNIAEIYGKKSKLDARYLGKPSLTQNPIWVPVLILNSI